MNGDGLAHSSASGRTPRRDAAEGDVALLLDWENLKWSLQHRYGVAPNVSSLVEAAREYGRLVLARAYADWTMPVLRDDAPNLYRAGIDPVYVPERKNSADLRLVVDAVDMCGRLAHVSTYLLVTGDRDLLHALNFLRLSGRRVVVVGVGEALSAQLSAAADAVLLYERDIEPLRGGAPAPGSPQAGGSTPPPMETVFGWVTAVLRERGVGAPYPFTTLGGELKRRHGLHARAWYGVPFKQLMLQAERAGQVHLSTIGGMDHASLPGEAAPPAPGSEAAAAEDEAAQPLGSGGETRIDALSDDERHDLLRFLRDLGQSSPYMTFKYIVANLVYRSVLPRLSTDQLAWLINDLRDRGVLEQGERTGLAEATGQPFSFATFSLNEAHPLVRAVLAAPAAETAGARHDGEPVATVDPFAALLPALAEARQMSGAGYFPSVQQKLEARLGTTVRALGYSSLSLFFREAERRGLVHIGWHNGAHVLVPADEDGPVTAAPTAGAVGR